MQRAAGALAALLVLLLVAAPTPTASDGSSAEDEESCAAEDTVPAMEADSAEAVAEGMKCDFCRKVTTDAFWSAIGLTPLGTAFNERYNKSLTGGDFVDIIDEMCELQEEQAGGRDWDFEADGVPPTAMMDFYTLWAERDTQTITALWNKDRLRSQGLSEVADDASRRLFMLSCDQHLRTIDTELVDDFSSLLRKHQKQLHELDWNSREMYARMLSDHEPVHEQIGEVCSILCDKGEAAKKALKRKRKQVKKKKKEKTRRQNANAAGVSYGQLLKEAKKSKVLFPGV